MKQALNYIVGKKMPDLNSWQTSIAIILNEEMGVENTVSSIATKSLLTENEVVMSFKALMNSGFKMGKNNEGNLVFNIGNIEYLISIAKKKETTKETGSIELYGKTSAKKEQKPSNISKEDKRKEQLIEAISRKNMKAIDMLLKVSVDWGYTNDENESVLSMGCSKQDLNILNKLIDKGLDVQECLMWVCQNGNKYRGLVAYFVKHGANTNTGAGLMPLQWAIFTGAIGVAQELIENGADVNYVSESGEPLLQTAVDSDNSQVVELMIMNGADMGIKNHDGDGPLHWAASTGGVDIIKMLLFNEANPKDINHDGETAYDVAVKQGKERVVSVLGKY